MMMNLFTLLFVYSNLICRHMAWLHIFFHSFLFVPFFLQSLTPSCSKSFSTACFHILRGLPLPLLIETPLVSICLTGPLYMVVYIISTVSCYFFSSIRLPLTFRHICFVVPSFPMSATFRFLWNFHICLCGYY